MSSVTHPSEVFPEVVMNCQKVIGRSQAAEFGLLAVRIEGAWTIDSVTLADR